MTERTSGNHMNSDGTIDNTDTVDVDGTALQGPGLTHTPTFTSYSDLYKNVY